MRNSLSRTVDKFRGRSASSPTNKADSPITRSSLEPSSTPECLSPASSAAPSAGIPPLKLPPQGFRGPEDTSPKTHSARQHFSKLAATLSTFSPRQATGSSPRRSARRQPQLDPYLDQVQSVPIELPPPQEEYVTRTRFCDSVPRFQCRPFGPDCHPLPSFVSTIPQGYFTVLGLFCAGDEWNDCKESMRTLEQLYRKVAPSGHCQFLAIARNQTEKELRAFRQGPGAGFTIPMAPDPGGLIFNLFATGGVPRFYLLDNFYAISNQVYGSLPSSFTDKVHRLAEEIAPNYLSGMKFDPHGSNIGPAAGRLSSGLHPDLDEDEFYRRALGREPQHRVPSS